MDRGQPASPVIVREALSSKGQPLERAIRNDMEQRFGRDFSEVRVHTDEKAAASAQAVHARAYTFGRDVAFASGQFAPATPAGQRLLAHELTHVLQQESGGPVLQRQPQEKAQPAGGDLQLPWTHGDYSLFELNSSGIRFLVAGGKDQEKAIRAKLPAIGKQIAKDNARISDAARRVAICIVAPTTTRFALWKGTPVLALQPSDASVETAAHEMGHAIFFALAKRGESQEKDAAGSRNFRLAVADIYARLGDTDPLTIDGETHPAGLWIADPSQWAPGSAKEHPWQDPDEFFASAKAAFQINRKGFQAAIARATRADRRVAAPARELLALLGAFLGKGVLPTRALPAARATAAATELGRETGVSNIEDTLVTSPLLDWLVNPANRPKQVKARPALEEGG